MENLFILKVKDVALQENKIYKTNHSSMRYLRKKREEKIYADTYM